MEIRWFQSSENNEDIIVNDFTSVKKTEVHFERKDFQRKLFAVQQVINECAIYDVVNISGLVYNLQHEKTTHKEGAPLLIRKGIVKDQIGSIEIVLLSSVIAKISNNNCYNFKKIRIRKFMNNPILKSAESTTVTKNNNINIELTNDELNASSFEKNCKCQNCSNRYKKN